MSEIKGKFVELNAADDHRYQAYHVEAGGEHGRRGGLVVVQEIFGVNSHVRSVADGFAAQGYEVYAPAVFDRVERHVELGYTDQDIERGFALKEKCDMTGVLLDVQAPIATMRPEGTVGIVGYCWGGLISWMAACRTIGLSGAVCYYGGGIAQNLAHKPRCPVLMHFGSRDKHISAADVDAVRAAQPGVEILVYDADHGFNCDQRGSYDAPSAKQALERTLAFFRAHVG
ncbi:MAG TPA: dienelactone hydrolase family protein [Alphaproteobacteria bacterium]